jgi:hypothetical protein
MFFLNIIKISLKIKILMGHKKANAFIYLMVWRFFLFSSECLVQWGSQKKQSTRAFLLVKRQQMTRYSPDLINATQENTYYALTMFPYPSGA